MIAPIIGAAIFGSFLAYGLRTGKMPAGRVRPADKGELPIAYWTLAAIWAVCCFACLIWAALLI